MGRLCFLSILLSLAGGATGQPPHPYDPMVAPMDIPMVLAGNFMELRAGHFHSGLDFKTNGREGEPVKAVKAGFVSRIRSSPWGFGKALYVQHADGTTTVYGHLSRFAGAIAEVALKAHYEGRASTIDTWPPAGSLEVKQGEVIAWSGNTGGSSAPHLHFELRHTGDQHAIDPQGNGITLADGIAPEILGVRLYPLDSASRAAPYPGKARGFAASKANGSHALNAGARVAAIGTVGLAVHAIDRYDLSPNKCGVRRIDLLVDSVPAFSVHLDEVDFDLNRYCDAHMDYALYKDQDMHYHRLYKLPNNPLAIYGSEPMQGRIDLKPGERRKITIVVTDANGNTSTLRFLLHGADEAEAATWPRPKRSGTRFDHAVENRFTRDDLRFVLPPLALYDDLDLTWSTSPKPNGAFAALHHLGDPLTPMRLAGRVSIRTDDLPAAIRDKAVVARMDGPGRYAAQGGTWEAGWVSADVRAFGSFTVLVDTVPPKVTPVDLQADLSGHHGFTIRVSDDLSGIDRWTATLDGKWILMEYDPKAKTLVHHFDAYSEGTGSRVLKLDVADERKNSSSLSFSFTR